MMKERPGGSANHSSGGDISNSEQVPPDAGRLDAWDVFALIANKMVGTGIFTTPTTVLLLIGSKRECVVFWLVGWFLTAIRSVTYTHPNIHEVICVRIHLLTYSSMFIYLEFSKAYPYIGGELIYVGSPHNSQYALIS
jgi:hypothetical protein